MTYDDYDRGDDDREEGRRLNAEEEYDREMEVHDPEPCECGASDWELTGREIYGADADGRRGVSMYVFECSGCGAEREVIDA